MGQWFFKSEKAPPPRAPFVFHSSIDFFARNHLIEQSYLYQRSIYDYDDEPDYDYHSAEIYPDATELCHPKKQELPSNIVKGSYNNVCHYLNTHFWLLREDFIKPIRENLVKYLDNSNAEITGINIHQVQFTRIGVKNEEACFCVEVQSTLKGSSLNGNNEKRFMIGSMVIISSNRFKTIYCARVVCNANLPYKKFLIAFAETVTDVNYNVDFLMIECDAFFEPYHNVLKALQGMSEASLTMSRYLVHAQTNVERPLYLRTLRTDLIYKTKFNASQNEAMRGAFSREMAIIQGPPGTGKTFLGLEIAREILVSYTSCWYQQSPMLVISLTNHALDQFLEGLTDATKDILRCGSQSKNPTMSKYSLRERRFEFYKSNPIATQRMKREMGSVLKELNPITKRIETISRNLDLIRTYRNKGLIQIGHPSFSLQPRDMIIWLLHGCLTKERELLSPTSGSPITISIEPELIEEMYISYLMNEKNSNGVILSESIMKNAAEKLSAKLQKMKRNSRTKSDWKHLQNIYELLLHKTRYFTHCLNNVDGLINANVSVNDFCDYNQKAWRLSGYERWRTYKFYLRKWDEALKTELKDLSVKHKKVYKKFKEIEERNNLMIMKKQKIIGMTTTVSARMHSIIRQLKCPIVIVEEAAEVLESHIIPVLTEYCQHLILIGDHKQLRPSTADYEIETTYKLGVSMFERMINNGIPCYTLNVQHRMRPEISALIVPAIYPVLYDDVSVTKFDQIRGMAKCLYFVTHNQLEGSSGQSSKNNVHEAQFLIQLAAHLIKNEYRPEEITILTTYLGQVPVLLKEQRKNKETANIKISTVDNFQGEENKIILLSLVRNNKFGKIGFLSIENRICVALSRAKEGLYIMGNITQLTARSQLWRKIGNSLRLQNAVGPKLILKCQRHSVLTSVENPSNFCTLSPNGGCNKECQTKLSCGHYCGQICHTKTKSHFCKKCQISIA